MEGDELEAAGIEEALLLVGKTADCATCDEKELTPTLTMEGATESVTAGLLSVVTVETMVGRAGEVTRPTELKIVSAAVLAVDTISTSIEEDDESSEVEKPPLLE